MLNDALIGLQLIDILSQMSSDPKPKGGIKRTRPPSTIPQDGGAGPSNTTQDRPGPSNANITQDAGAGPSLGPPFPVSNIFA